VRPPHQINQVGRRAIGQASTCGKMLPCTEPSTLHVHFGGGIRKVRNNFVEMQMFKQGKTGRTENMCILQNLHSKEARGRLHHEIHKRSRARRLDQCNLSSSPASIATKVDKEW